ncbi:DUF4158 domain-containing protein [Deinococcus sp. LM3]|uniref:DUF4158 domain-containing protein n=1 Tax=Deinococcus sp. LM3 TaxID=1938608 RepID=UPI0009CBE367|nr:DUF4158 domain-containing protein [Deinococcus sp. LM3]OOV11862.1 hypothetical protein BXU09_19880 [Deinococcus sp. LM3]
MKHDWSPEELAGQFTLTHPERAFLGFKGEAASLSLAALLKTFQPRASFWTIPKGARVVVDFLAQQLAVSPACWAEVDWSTRTARRYRDEVAHFCGFRAFRGWMKPR